MADYISKYSNGAAVDAQLDLASTHATRHKSGGADSIKLDELAAPTDVTTLNASTAAHGLLKKLSNVATQYMDGQGNWTSPPGTWASNFGSEAGKICEGSDARLSDARAPLSHVTSHKSGGTDSIKLDELAAPTDVTTLNASTAAHGLLKKLDNDITHFLRGDGAWAVPPGGSGGGGQNYFVKIVAPLGYSGTADYISGADASTIIQQAIDELPAYDKATGLGGGVLFFLPGNYTISTAINLKSGVYFEGIGKVTFTSTLGTTIPSGDSGDDNYNIYPFNANGTYAASTISISAATRNGRSITVADASTLAAGDYIKISDNVTYGGASYKNGEIVKIASISGTTVKLETALQDSYTSTPIVRKITLIEDVGFKNIHYVGPGRGYIGGWKYTGGTATNKTNMLMDLYGCHKFTFEKCIIEEFSRCAIDLHDCINFRFLDCVFRNNDYFVNDMGYSIALGNATDNVFITNCMFLGVGRHYIAAGAGNGGTAKGDGLPRTALIENCVFENSTAQAIDAHWCTRIKYSVNNCKFLGCNYGVQVSGQTAIISNCRFEGCNRAVLTYSPCYTLFVGNRVVDCGVYTGGDGFYILGDCDVINNEFSITADPANSNATFWFEDNIGTGPGVALYGGTVNIIGNTFRTYTVPLISDGFSGATPLSVKLNIINNIFDSAGGVSFISLTSNTAIAFTSLVIKGNKISGRIYLTSFPSVIISGNDINATGNALTITNAAGLHIINNNQITAASTGIVLTAPSSNSSVIKIRRNYIAAPTGVTNTSSYYTALDDDNVRI